MNESNNISDQKILVRCNNRVCEFAYSKYIEILILISTFYICIYYIQDCKSESTISFELHVVYLLDHCDQDNKYPRLAVALNFRKLAFLYIMNGTHKIHSAISASHDIQQEQPLVNSEYIPSAKF